jgi:hypothetical protein
MVKARGSIETRPVICVKIDSRFEIAAYMPLRNQADQLTACGIRAMMSAQIGAACSS